MEFDDVLEQVLTLLERDKRLSYRGIKRRFGLDDQYLEDLKEELLFSHPEISEADGRGLIWNGEGGQTVEASETTSQSPASYTPQHLAERIRAEQAAMESRGSAKPSPRCLPTSKAPRP